MINFLKKSIKRFLGNQLARGSLVLFVGMMIGSFGSYLFHLLMGRMLGPEEYGVLSSIISILYFLSIPTMVFTLVIAKFISSYLGRGESQKIGDLFSLFFKKSFLLSSAISLAFLLLTPFLQRFLKIDSTLILVVITGVIFFSLPLAVNRGFLQGLMNFSWLALISASETILKLFLAIFLVLSGLKSFGATLAYSISSFLSLLIAFYPVRNYFSFTAGKKIDDFGKMVKFSLPVLISNISFISLYSLDVILIKHYFSAYQAGLYASVSILGKVIFWFASPVVTVLFPLMSKRQSEKRNFFEVLILAILFIGLAGVGIIFLYRTYPNLMIILLFGKQYLEASRYLFGFAIFIFLHTLSFSLVNAYLSLSKTTAVLLPGLAAISQGILIGLFHQDISQVILICQIVCGILLVSLLLFLPQIYAFQKKEK